MTTVKITKTINVPAKIVWQKVKDFDDIDKLSSIVNTCSVEGSGVGAKRVCGLDQGEIIETLTNLDEENLSLSYSIDNDDVPLPVSNYLGTCSIKALSDRKCEVSWSASFTPKGVEEAEVIPMLEGIFSELIDGLESMLAMPKIIRFHETGGADVLKIERLPLIKPGEGEVRLKVEALGLNRAEIMFREGQYLEDPVLPSRLGYEASGIVDAVGPGITEIQIGDRVSTIPGFSMVNYGVYGESAIVPENAVAQYPQNLSASEGAAIWIQYITAFGALVEFGKLKEDDSVLITASSSSVGIAAIQITKAAGALAIATTRGADKKQFLLDVGADHVIVTNEEDLVEKTLAFTDGKGARLIFDPVAGPSLEKLADAAASGGIIFEYGALSPEPTPFPLFSVLGKGLTIRGYTIFEITADPEKLARAKQYVYDGLESGALKPIIDRAFSLDEIVEAHQYMESNQQKGKIVVIV